MTKHNSTHGVMAHETPPAPCPSYGRCTYPDCGHFLDVTRGAMASRVKHADLIQAALAGQQIEFNDGHGDGWKGANAVWAINMMTNPEFEHVSFRALGVAVGRPVEPVDPCRPWCTCGAWPHKSWCGYRNPDAKEDQRGV